MKYRFLKNDLEVNECENKACQEDASALINLICMIKKLRDAYGESLKEIKKDDPKKVVFETIIYNLDFMIIHADGCKMGECSKAHT